MQVRPHDFCESKITTNLKKKKRRKFTCELTQAHHRAAQAMPYKVVLHGVHYKCYHIAK